MKKTQQTTPQTDKGFIQIACGSQDNDILMALAGSQLGGTELSIILIVIRKTWGWKKKEDWISLTQFEKDTKRSRQTIVNAINELVKKNVLVKKTVLGIKTTYTFNKDFSSWLVKKTVPVQKTRLVKKQPDELVKKTSTTSKENCTSLVKKTVPTKETITKETIQKKLITKKRKEEELIRKLYLINEDDLEKIANKYNVPIGFVASKYEDMINWHESTGQVRIDWIATLRGFVKRDAIKRIDYAKQNNIKRGADLSHL